MTYSFAYVDEDEVERRNFANDAYNAGFNKNEIEIIDPAEFQQLGEMVNHLFQMHIDALIVDYDLTQRSTVGYKGSDVIDRILHQRPDFPCFIRTNWEFRAVKTTSDVNMVYPKLEKNVQAIEAESTPTFFDRVKSQIDHYRSTIEKKEDELLELLEIPVEKINSDQIEQILELDHYLEKSIGDETAFSKSVKRNALMAKRNFLIEETERLIKKIQDHLDATK